MSQQNVGVGGLEPGEHLPAMTKLLEAGGIEEDGSTWVYEGSLVKEPPQESELASSYVET